MAKKSSTQEYKDSLALEKSTNAMQTFTEKEKKNFNFNIQSWLKALNNLELECTLLN